MSYPHGEEQGAYPPPPPGYPPPGYGPPGYGPPGFPPPGYGPPGYPVAYERPTDGLAVASLVLGILGLIILYVIGPILAVIFGHVSLRRTATGEKEGRGMAIAGLVLGYLGIVGTVLVIVVVFVIGSSVQPTPQISPGFG
ncbi:MAG: DUF4190 domain-containing protein [Actinobacteria bacterium]|nr:DUF4190 domain-containing protein [Actinomycetota bacterium]MBO0834280.1 DUF4190 domain-containing protein [Actinomycetota bacterium]